jgi:hypothetical protein
MGRASCLRVQLRRASEMSLTTCCKRDGQHGLQVRAHAGVDVLPFPSHQPTHSPLRQPGSRCTPAYHVEHSPQSRWIVGAGSLNRRTPQVLAAASTCNQNPILAIPVLYRPVLSPVAYRCRLACIFSYQCARVYRTTLPPAAACSSLLSDQDASLSDWRKPPAVKEHDRLTTRDLAATHHHTSVEAARPGWRAPNACPAPVDRSCPQPSVASPAIRVKIRRNPDSYQKQSRMA